MVSKFQLSELFPERSTALQESKGVVAAIHQPNYIPWLGYFFKISRADKFVFLDVVPAPKSSFVNRNSIKTQHGPEWLTIPIHRTGHSGQPICDIETDNIRGWPRRHLATFRTNYSKAPYFKEIFALLENVYGTVAGDRSSLADFNIMLIRAIANYIGLSPQWLRASELGVAGHKTDLLLSICVSIGATTYLAGSGAKAYQQDDVFANAGITTMYSPFSQRSYPQRFGDFVENLSIVDVLMNCGCQGTRRLLDLDANVN
jgi:hypothetical protein